MRTLLLFAFSLASLIPGCDDRTAAAPPAPQEVSEDSIAQFCNMNLSEHPGPKGQIFIRSDSKPFWFASVHDVFAFLILKDTPKDVVAVYVNDMAKAKNWEKPEPGTWLDARKAVYVIGSRKKGGMGEDEAVPFSDRTAAERFAGSNGGRIVTFDEMPRDYILANGGGRP